MHRPSAGDGAHAEPAVRNPQDVMGHGRREGMSMDSMIRDMRNRFLVAAILSVPIILWSPVGRQVIGFTIPAPFGPGTTSSMRPRAGSVESVRDP